MISTQKSNDQWLKLQRYWELIEVLVRRNLKIRYRGSILGVYWSLLNPLTMTLLYTAIFGNVFKTYYASLIDYVLSVFTGLLVFNFFSASTLQALASVVTNGALLNKVSLPVSVFPVSMIAANVFQFVVGGLPLLALATLIKSGFDVTHVLALALPFFALILLCTGIGFFVSALYVFFRDLSYFYELIMFVAWIGSPVFYPKDIVPDRVKPFLDLNPLASVIESFRQITLTQDVPNFSLILHAFLGGSIIFGIGWFFFQWSRPKFMDLL